MGIVRALFATSPGLGHVFPTISLAHALRAAGHEVLVATPGGKEAANAGLHVVDTAPGVDIGAVFQQAASEQPEEFDYSTDVDTEKGLEFVGAIFAKLSGVSVDLTVSAAESWRPDVVVYSSMEGTGPLVAAKLGVPAVSHGFGFADEASMTANGMACKGFPRCASRSTWRRRAWSTGRCAAGRCGTCRTTEAACCPSGCSNGPRARASR